MIYALSGVAAVNEAVLAATRPLLDRYAADPERQPHLVARIDDPRHADHWRGRHGGSASRWFEDALSPAEATAQALVSDLFERELQFRPLVGPTPTDAFRLSKRDVPHDETRGFCFIHANETHVDQRFRFGRKGALLGYGIPLRLAHAAGKYTEH